MIKYIYIIGINLLTFILMGWDKYCSKTNKWRISEANLLGIALLGGSIGEIFGMFIFRHKTKHLKFKILLPLFLLINILLYIKILL